MMGQFKNAIETRNKSTLKNISQFGPGRSQFVEQLLNQYRNIQVNISGFQFIAKENRASALVELNDLVDINGKQITPGNWNKFSIIVRNNRNNKLRVYW